jgi:hypothetical protein
VPECMHACMHVAKCCQHSRLPPAFRQAELFHVVAGSTDDVGAIRRFVIDVAVSLLFGTLCPVRATFVGGCIGPSFGVQRIDCAGSAVQTDCDVSNCA